MDFIFQIESNGAVEYAMILQLSTNLHDSHKKD
jgi:hypothetical protein